MRRILYDARATVTNQVYISTEHQPTSLTQTPAMASTSFSAPTTASFDPNDKFVICDEELEGVQIEVKPVSCTGSSDGVRHLHDNGNVWAAFQGKQMILPFSGCFAFSITVKEIRQTSVQAVALKLICENGLGKESNFALLKVDEEYFMSCNPGKDKREFVAYLSLIHI